MHDRDLLPDADSSRPGPPPLTRIQAAERIRAIISQAQAHADAHETPDSEIDEAVREAMLHVRGRN